MKLSTRICVVLSLGLLFSLAGNAQTGLGIIRGNVIGRDGMPVSQLMLRLDRIVVTPANTRTIAQSFTVTTGRNGGFSMDGLPPGTYVLRLSENGTALVVRADTPQDLITVADNRESIVNIDLRNALPPVGPIAAVPLDQAQNQASQDHAASVLDVLKRMQTIQPGRTRDDLLKVFTPQVQGIYSDLQRTFLSRECPYFKVDVEFEAVGRTRDQNGRMPMIEDSRDVILKISKPYVELPF